MPRNNSFEGIGSGTAVTVGNSGGASGDAFDVVAGSVVANDSAALIGSRGLVATLASSTESYVAWDVTGTTHYVRGYFQVPAGGPTHNMRLIYGHTGGTKNWEIRITIPGANIDLLVNGSQRILLGSDGGTAAFTNGAWYRIEGFVSSTSSEVRVYNTTGTLLDSGTWTGSAVPGTQVRYGLHNGSAVSSTMNLDGVGYDSVAWLGEYPVIPDAPIERINGFNGIPESNSITTLNSGGTSGDAFDSVSGTVTAVSAGSFTGARGMRAALAASTESYVAWNVQGTEHYYRTYFKTSPTSTTHNARMVWSGTAASTTSGWDTRQIVSVERVGFATRNTTRFELGPNGSGTGTLSRNTWYRVEAHVTTGASGSVTMRLYNDQGTLLDSGTWNGSIDASTELRYGLGNGANITSSHYMDAVGYSNQDWLGPTEASNMAPTVSLSADSAAVTSFTMVTLTAVASDPDGSAPSVVIEQVSGPAVTLTGSGLTRMFEAPALQAGASLTFMATATDASDEATDSVSVIVRPHREFVRIAGSWAPRRVRTRQNDEWA